MGKRKRGHILQYGPLYSMNLPFTSIHIVQKPITISKLYKDCENLHKAIECYQGKLDVATSMIEKAIITNPTYAEAYNNNHLLTMNYIGEGHDDTLFEWCAKLDGGLVGEGGDAVERLVALIGWSIDGVMEVKGGDVGIWCTLRLWLLQHKEK
ncbi:hypothetical protein JHK87_043394 [Glycine soja]|nr:hypothetical protein JHK87_043394 [Glycine soja]